MSGDIVLVGWHTATGLGTQNRDLARHLPVSTWIVPTHPKASTFDRPSGFSGTYHVCSLSSDRRMPRSALDTIRKRGAGQVWLVCEQGYFQDTFDWAHEFGAKVVCLVNLEWLPKGGWDGVDLYIAPTEQTAETLQAEDVPYVFVPMGVDTERIPFRLRRRAHRFVHSAGFRGKAERKGLDVVLRSGVHATVYTQADKLPCPAPAGAAIQGEVADARALYDAADVAIQPSRYEGVGLSMLECQAAGVPVISTETAPMTEYAALARIPVKALVPVQARRQVQFAEPDEYALAGLVESWRGRVIAEASHRARAFAESRDWRVVAPKLRRVLEAL